MEAKLRAGNRWHNGKQIPINSKICLSKSKREFILIGVFKEDYNYKAQVKYLDDMSVVTIDYNLIEKYLI